MGIALTAVSFLLTKHHYDPTIRIMEINREKKTITVNQNTGITISVTLLIMFAGAIYTLATTFTDLRGRINQAEQNIITTRTDITNLQSDNVSSKVEFSKIQTQLSNIETTLLEIKEYQRR